MPIRYGDDLPAVAVEQLARVAGPVALNRPAAFLDQADERFHMGKHLARIVTEPEDALAFRMTGVRIGRALNYTRIHHSSLRITHQAPSILSDMKRALEAVGTVGLIGVVAVANFGLPDFSGASEQDALAARQASFEQRWGDPADRIDYSAASYPNCDAARAAGVAPLYAGEPGYGPHLDRDNDGVACEPYRGR